MDTVGKWTYICSLSVAANSSVTPQEAATVHQNQGFWKSVWSGTKNYAGKAWDWAKDKGQQAWEWAKSDTGKFVLTTVGLVGLSAAAFFTGNPILGSMAVNGWIGAISGGGLNMARGGSFTDGYMGGAINGTLTGAAGEAAPALRMVLNFGGGFANGTITSKSNNPNMSWSEAAERGIVSGTTQLAFSETIGKVFDNSSKLFPGKGYDAVIARGTVKYTETVFSVGASTSSSILYDAFSENPTTSEAR